MSQQQVAQLLSRLLGSVARYSVLAVVGVTGLQSSLYTGLHLHPSMPRLPLVSVEGFVASLATLYLGC